MPPINNFNKTILALAICHAVAMPAQAATITVDSLLDDNGVGCTLREAIANANNGNNGGGNGCVAGVVGADTIEFDNALTFPSTITLNSPGLVINDGLTINGPGQDQLTISGGDNYRVFDITGNIKQHY